MPTWVLACVKCNFKFEYSQIGDVGMSSWRASVKPDIPPEGNECVCPNCGHNAIYNRTDLVYQAALLRTWPTR